MFYIVTTPVALYIRTWPAGFACVGGSGAKKFATLITLMEKSAALK